jgi:hypothetical protein
MADDPKIDLSKYVRPLPENGEVCRQITPQRETRPQAEKERAPDYFQRTQEREGRSEWSGGSAGGGSWGGRSR